MKYKIVACILLMLMVVGCTSKKVNEHPTGTMKTTQEENQSVTTKTEENTNEENDNTIEKENNDQTNNNGEKENIETTIEEISGPIKKFIGDWKVKAAFDEDFFITEELSCQDNGIGIYPDHMIIYALEVNDYIICDVEVEDIQDNSLTLKIMDRKTSSGRSRKDNTKLILKLDEENHILKGNFTYETEYGISMNTYTYEKDLQGLLNDFYIAKQEEKSKLDDEQISISKKIQNEWFQDYRDIKENVFLRFDEYNGIASYEIREYSIWSNFYDLEGNLSWKSGEETYNVINVTDDTVILEVEKKQGETENIIGLYYTIQLQDDQTHIRKLNYLSENQYSFTDQKVVIDSLDLVATKVNHMNNLYAFDENQKQLFNKIIGSWGTFKTEYGSYIYNLDITPYYIDFYEYATGFMESINFKILDINVKEKNMLLDVNQYAWWDEINGETKFLDNQILIGLSEDENKLYFKILHEQKENLFFEMAKDYINDVEFEKKQEE